MSDVTAIGELLIDFIEYGVSDQGNPLFEANPGGAPCNVLAMLSKMGKKTTFIGKVGDDMFGKQLKDALVETNVGTEGLCYDKEIHTTLAYVHKTPDGDRDFSFYRQPGADIRLTKEDINAEIIKDSKLFHFGSLSLTDEPVKTATLHAIEVAKSAGITVSFDPNLREPLWDSLDKAKEEIERGMALCDILKISDNEIKWITGISDYDEAILALAKKYPNIKVLFLTLGKEGSKAYCNGVTAFAPTFPKKVVETTGAGDTFMGMTLNQLLDEGLENIGNLSEETLTRILTLSNVTAGLITTRKGALRVMPDKAEIENYLKENNIEL
ncbi:MAG: carbohydrate kinase [Lachnospiraceae bacterium]|nr:carbohydrate kinase [Lachnospiraceae bacterium]